MRTQFCHRRESVAVLRVALQARLAAIALIRPFPAEDFRYVVAITRDVLFVLDELVAQKVLEMSAQAL